MLSCKDIFGWELDGSVENGGTVKIYSENAPKDNSFTEITKGDFGTQIRICGRPCDTYCSVFTEMDDCLRQGYCGWCSASGGSCVAGDDSGPDDTLECAAVDYDYECSQVCSALTDCSSCTAESGCGWCDDLWCTV